MIRYFVSIDENGNILHGSTVDDVNGVLFHPIYSYQVTEEIWNNQDKYRFNGREWELTEA